MYLDLPALFPAGTTALYLDDVRTPQPTSLFTWVIVRSYDQFCHYIRQHGMPPFISFDHDLADEQSGSGTLLEKEDGEYSVWQEKTGYDAAKWLVDWCMDHDLILPYFTVHSANPAGADNILGLLNNFQKFQGRPPTGSRAVW